MDGSSPIAVRDRERFEASPAAALAVDCLLAGIEAAQPSAVIDERVSLDGATLAIDGTTYDLDAADRVLVVGGGNAAGRVASALEGVLGERIDDGIVVTDDPVPLDRVASITGAHPVPDDAAMDGANQVLDLVDGATERDLVLGVITGGGSALLPAPAGDVSLADLQDLTDALVRSGATIDEINAVRKHVSALKGGRLARAAAPATVATLVFSDVVGDDPATVASGPFSPDPTSYAEARSVLERHGIDAPGSIRRRLDRGAAAGTTGAAAETTDAAVGATDATAGDSDATAGNSDAAEAPTETPGPDEPAFDAVDVHVLASNDAAIDAAAEAARDAGFDSLVLSTRIEGEAREVGTVHAAIADEVRASGRPIEPPAVLLSGGETTVTLGDASGAGGPNQEVALAAALDLADPSTVIASVDTDGIDGATDAAGALVTGDTVGEEVSAATARAALDAHDAYPVLDDAGALLRTGPTGTNVNDLRVIVVLNER
ncbi:putative glycerate kinase [Salinarchaeum sp. Harcht-Bsk1]|uniref:glycerate kinase type-2 family protein n=1 Tax=Salinarchaeum sp. Harcht-Bsk1 TaxID=1333523 RepID=UPI000342291D|nr:DUF4147 domain-containing protein [Salinarchaeum sp. Harcht-Bsk1]AGN01686.1 putative glycerate kinase [Salinarchaeum sp. Harcht-Bsk1]